MAREVCGEEDNKSRSSMVLSSGSSAGFVYSDHHHLHHHQQHVVSSSSNPSTNFVDQIQGFESNINPAAADQIFNLTNGMEMIGFSKNLQQQQSDSSNNNWKGFFGKHGGGTGGGPGPSSSSSKPINESTTDFYHHHHHHHDHHGHDQFNSDPHNLMVGGADGGPPDHSAASWQENSSSRLMVDDSSLRCVFPCEGNERPSQGLSLSLCSTNPSTIGLQSFELRQDQEMRFFTTKSSPAHVQQQQQQQVQNNQHHHGQLQMRNSKYLGPAQDLLNEFCSLGTKQISDGPKHKNQKLPNKQQWQDDDHHDQNSSSSSRKHQSLYSLEFMELQKRKTKLLSMLEELDRRYKHYCDQMKAVVSSFEAVAGNGAATVYSALASKAMSKHFRCLRDGIVAQIQATKKAMGEKDPVAPGTTKGETPRLRILDQTLRQQRAFQQMSMMESHPWRPQRGLPERSVSVLRAWLFEHFLHPYPSDVDKHILARQTGLSRSQVSNWFINARVRLWKPMVEEMYLEETKEHDDVNNNNNNNNNMGSNSDGVTGDLDDDQDNNNNNDILNSRHNYYQTQLINPNSDQKPTSDQLLRIDSECLSSIISNSDHKNSNDTPKTTSKLSFQNQNQNHHHHLQSFVGSSYGAMELDFSSYNATTGAGGVSYANANGGGGGGGGGGVSLTLGLQQHGGGGVSLAFSPASQSSLFYTRSDHHQDHIDQDCNQVQVQYSLLDGDGQNNLPYRNLMGAQLLHDLAG